MRSAIQTHSSHTRLNTRAVTHLHTRAHTRVRDPSCACRPYPSLTCLPPSDFTCLQVSEGSGAILDATVATSHFVCVFSDVLHETSTLDIGWAVSAAAGGGPTAAHAPWEVGGWMGGWEGGGEGA